MTKVIPPRIQNIVRICNLIFYNQLKLKTNKKLLGDYLGDIKYKNFGTHSVQSTQRTTLSDSTRKTWSEQVK